MLMFIVPAQAQSPPDIDRFSSDVFVGLDFSERADVNVPTGITTLPVLYSSGLRHGSIKALVGTLVSSTNCA